MITHLGVSRREPECSEGVPGWGSVGWQARRQVLRYAVTPDNWTLRHNLWPFDQSRKVLVPHHGDLRRKLVAAHHANPFSGHQGRERTLELVRRNYSWKGMAEDFEVSM